MQKRFIQLDSLRGIAAAMVVLHHWFPAAQGLGGIGVELFFVLSGFLITRILLDLRSALEAGTLGAREALARFWQSRAARILPVAFLTIALVYLAGDSFEPRDTLFWHASFLSNLYFFRHGVFDSYLSHFWTLAVEQQFYLFWPLVVIWMPRRWLEPAIIALVALAPLARLLLVGAGYELFEQYNLPPFSNFDVLGLGALAGVWSRMPQEQTGGRRRVLLFLGIAAVLALVAFRFLPPFAANPEQTLYALVFVNVIAAGYEGIPGLAGRVLEWRPLIGLGTISYGVYVYHVFAPKLVGAALEFTGGPDLLFADPVKLVLSGALTLAAAVLSWRLMERPILEATRARQRRARVKSVAPVKAAGLSGDGA
jgi:peptidoglycan/LPS O-acetylase OafA/YrhL